jgi:uncharacterized RDD family membrane protein YckC
VNRPSGTSAGFARRFAALLYDSLLIVAVLLVYSALAVGMHRGRAITQASGAPWYLYRAGEVLVIGAYYLLNWMRSGQTLGMRAWRLYAVDAQGGRLKAGQALRRLAWGALAWGAGALGVLWLYLDPQRLALHDRLSDTRLLYVPRT